MKTWGVLSFLLLSGFVVRSQEDDYEWIRRIKNEKGRITMLDFDSTWIIIPLSNPDGRYYSRQLPDAFKIEGLPVTYGGWVGKIPPNVRMIATPLKLSHISVGCGENKKYKLKKRTYKF